MNLFLVSVGSLQAGLVDSLHYGFDFELAGSDAGLVLDFVVLRIVHLEG